MARKIQHKRGLEANLPQLDVAEIAFTTDSKKPFIGSADGNVEIAKKADVDAKASKTELTNAVSPKADKTYVDTELGKKASTDEVSAVSAQLADKASQEYVNTLNTQIETTRSKIVENVSLPQNFNRWKLLDPCTNASKWGYNSAASTTAGTVTAVTQVDTTSIPSSFAMNEEMKKPWLFSGRGSMRGLGDAFGNQMLKFEVDPGGEAFFHAPLSETEDFSTSGEILYAIWTDTVSTDVISSGIIQPVVYHKYPTVLTDFHRAVDVSSGMNNGQGDWLLTTIPSMRYRSSPKLWGQYGGSPYGDVTLSTVGGVGFRAINNSTDKKLRFYISGIFRIDNTLDKGKLIIDFDDGFLSQYENGFRYMYDTYGYKGNMGIVGSWIEQGYHGAFAPGEYPTMSKEQILEVQSAGWDITSHTWSHKVLGFSGDTPDMQYNEIQKNYQWLSDIGITKGKRFLIYPEGSWNRWTPDVARRFHVMGRGAAMFMQPSPTVRQFHYPGLDAAGWTESAWRSTLQAIQDQKMVAVRLFHHIGTGAYNPIDAAKFRTFIDAIQEYDIDVITWSDFYDNHVVRESL